MESVRTFFLAGAVVARWRSHFAYDVAVQVWRRFATLAEQSESGRGLNNARPTLHKVCYAVEPELVEGVTDCCEWRTGTTCELIPLWVRHGNSA